MVCVLLALLLVDGCDLPSSGAYPIRLGSPTITLAWDPPAVQPSFAPFAPSSYRVYWRTHLGGVWHLLAEVPASASPSLLVRHSDLGDGAFDFAVRAINLRNAASRFHTSLDAEADPQGGWYLIWLISE